MSPDEPGAPSSGPRDTGSMATFGAGVEQVDAPAEREGAPQDPPAEPDRPAAAEGGPRKAPAPRRRFLDDPDTEPARPKPTKAPRVRARKVPRVIRHIDPWSVLKMSALFFTSIFLIICVASAVLWNAGRSAGVIDDVESFITSLGFGNCEDIEGDEPEDDVATETTISGAGPQVGVDTSSTVPAEEEPEDERSTIPDEDGKCGEGQRLVGGFKFEDARIFQSFVLGGIVLVLSGTAFSVVMALLFNLISDLTGGLRVTVLHEEPAGARRRPPVEGAAEREPPA